MSKDAAPSHWPDCWLVHLPCALDRVMQFERQYRTLVARQADEGATWIADRGRWMAERDHAVADRAALRACLLLGLRVVAGLADPECTDAWYAERDAFVERAERLVEIGGHGA